MAENTPEQQALEDLRVAHIREAQTQTAHLKADNLRAEREAAAVLQAEHLKEEYVAIQAALVSLLPQAESVTIILHIAGQEQQFDGAWLKEVLGKPSASHASPVTEFSSSAAYLDTQDDR